jgi:hypothetical protein
MCFFSLLRALGLVTLVLLVGEIVVTAWNRGAFSEPNFYQGDAGLGLRLIPKSSMRLAYLGVEPADEVNINSEGYRGGEFPPAADSDIVVVGDSLSYGLGVGMLCRTVDLTCVQTFPATSTCG